MVELLCVFIFAINSLPFTIAHSQNNGVEENGNREVYFMYQQQGYARDCSEVKNECSSSNSSGVFLIKPDGYPEPFEVFCSNESNLGRWTVIQRRADGKIDFNRGWTDYKAGFGFLNTEFWIGNDKLSYLTNQGKYELRIDVELSNGTSLYASFSTFRTSDEWSQYTFADVGKFDGNIDISCPPNMVFGNCSCQPSCNDPSGLNRCSENCYKDTEECICASGFLKNGDRCVLPNECGCFLFQTKSILLPGTTHVNEECSEKCSCEDGSLICNSSYSCDTNAACGVQDGVRRCYCNRGYGGDGETCNVMYTDCHDAYQDNNTADGVYTILPTDWSGEPFSVLCNMSSNGGGWTVFQRRIDGESTFLHRNWTDYRNGFGSSNGERDFWLGNEKLYYLTKQKAYTLRVDITSSASAQLYAEYGSFSIADVHSMYQLTVSQLTAGNAGDGLHAYDNGGYFSTRDQDNDQCSYRNCGEGIGGAGWFTNRWCYQCSAHTWSCSWYGSNRCVNWCSYFNLNGDYNGVNGQSIYWGSHCDLLYADMKIRPLSV